MKKRVLLLLSFTSLLASEIDYIKNLSVDVRTVYLNYDYDKGFPDAEAFATASRLDTSKKFFMD